MKLLRMLIAVAVMAAGTTSVWAQDAQAEKTIIANERAINDAHREGECRGVHAIRRGRRLVHRWLPWAARPSLTSSRASTPWPRT